MAEEHSPTTAPVQTYLEISQKIETETGEYPIVELTHDFARILLACKSLIQQNTYLSERTVAAEKKSEDLLVNLFQKDIQIHELSEQIKEKDPDGV